MKRSYPDFIAEWHRRFQPNTTFNIAEADFQEFALDIVDTFGVSLPNVPEYAAGTTYTAGFLMRFTPASGQEAFYYSLQAGKLPAPVAVADLNWKVVPGPVPATQLGQTITLAQARNINGDTVVLGRDYAIELPQPSASGHAQVLSVAGIAEGWLATEGWLIVNNVRTRVEQIDYVAGTWQVKQYATVTPAQLAAVATTLATTLPQASAHTADYTLQTSDFGAVVPVSGSSAVVFTVPAGLGNAAPIVGATGTARVCYPLQVGSGQLSLVAGASVTLLTPPGGGLRAAGPGGRLILIWLDTNTVLVEGGI